MSDVTENTSGRVNEPVQESDGQESTREVGRRRLPGQVYKRGQQWREEFPYHWRRDDLVTRRDTLRFLVAGSGALFIATTALAITGTIRSPVNRRILPIARAGELAPNEVRVFTYPDQYAQGILVNLPGKGLVAYSDVCTHLSCAVLYQADQRRFFCPCHDGVFDAYTGDVLAGPPVRPLPIIDLTTINGIVYAVREVER